MSRDAMEVRDASPGYDLRTTKPTVPVGYKQTEVGVIPEDWEVFRFREHFTIYAGGDVPKDALSTVQSDKYPFPIFANAIQNKGLYGFTSQKRSKPGSLTITARGYLGHAEYRSEPFFPIVRLVVLETTGTVDSKFATYAINDRVEFAIESTGVPQLTAPQVGKYAIAAPADVVEQRAIATALSDVDALLEALDRLIAKKRDLKQAAMQQLLTGQTRLPGFEGEWETKPLGDIAEIRSGGTPSTSNPEFWNGGVAWCTPTDITALRGGKYLTATERTISKVGLRASSAEIIPSGSVIMTTRATIGECALNTIPMTTNQGFKNLIPFSAHAEFLYYLMTTQKDRLIQLCGGSTFLEVGKKQLQHFEVNLPIDIGEQEAIARFLSDMDAEIEALEQRCTKTVALKQAMMQELLTGRTRLIETAGRNLAENETRPSGRKANVHFMRSVLAAEIVDQLHAEPTFGHVKFEKMLFLVEHLCDVDTGSTYHRQAAGPYDNRALRSIDSQLRKQQWFDACEDNGRYRYMPLQKRGGHKHYFDRYFSRVAATFNEIVETFRGLDTERCEIVATLFSAWSDLLREKGNVSDEMIVHEVLNNWHESKQRIPEDRWLHALTWMREKGFVPKGAAST